MNKFIELIKGIGFRERNSNIPEFLAYTYNVYNITIVPSDDTRWSISKDGTWLCVDRNKRNFSLDEIDLLKEHFILELRNFKLNELLS